ncbi:MAG: Eco57I restriction-modification methylase domain-containing protein [Phycisphaerales bacterium]|nr:Eco57I restriction-modification methylase domain-containing protein [Phycisphaerales bacterium]
MKIDVSIVRRLLKECDFKTLFREQLGWDNYSAKLDIPLDGTTYSLGAIAEKRGFQVFTCPTIPDRPTRLKLDRQLTKSAREHLVIYVGADRKEQLWEWVRREPDKPAASRDYRFHANQSGDLLIQKLEALAIGLAEEEKLTIVDVTGKVKSALDVDKITRRFYDRFKTEHAGFMKFIKGIKHEPDLQWYTSLMLNRLMFVYFIQKKGFLDGDADYLRNRLNRMRQQHGKDKFYSFYRYFLLRLFHEGLGQAQKDRKTELDKLLGKVPFLNGGFFEVHDLEEKYPEIDIPDAAFEKLFEFFDAYRWHLDERPLRDDREVNPDVVGYIFEKYINQKQMGAYYTKEDITEYISKNTIIPFLFDAAEKKCAIAFKPDSALWRMLRDDPDRYIYSAIRYGVVTDKGDVIPLPPEIEAGIADVSKRGGWNKPAPQPFALPTETWREHVARRQRCLEIREKLRRGEVHKINDLVTLNLDIWQFARDAIVNCEGTELLRAFYRVIAGHIPRQSNEKYERGLSVLDPTCGSGAFLFAALRILETLYSDCLERMRRFVDELEHSGEKHRPEKYADFKTVLAEIHEHPNERYFVLKSTIINNLFGVDIMEEAVEICKLRLFLKLVAQVERVEQIEPLPDIDFNIRAGNTLVGYVSLDEVRRSQEGQFGFGDKEIKRIEEDALIADGAYKRFREIQVRHGGTVTPRDKAELRKRLNKLDAELDRYLAGEYGVKLDKANGFAAWRASHQPFHWLVEFFGIMREGGFDVIIGNPPYVEYSKVRQTYQIRGFATESAGNLYAMCSERSLQLLCVTGRFGFIVQAPVISTQRMLVLRQRLCAENDYLAISSYDDRPSKLFDGMHHCRLAILLARLNPATALPVVLTTRYHKWSEAERAQLFQTIAYWPAPLDACRAYVPKIRSAVELSVLKRLQTLTATVRDLLSSSDTPHRIFYKITGVGHWFTFTMRPPRFWRGNEEGSSTRESYVCFRSAALRDAVFCLLWSSLHYWFYQLRTNCRDFNPSDLESIPLANAVSGGFKNASTLANALIARLEESASVAEATYRVGGTVRFERFVPRSAKEEIDAMDCAFAEPYGLTAEELDFIINYDIKYRMGGSDDNADE